MTTPRYLSVESFKQWARDDVDADDNLIEEAINAAEEWLDDVARRRFVLVDENTTATARSYVPDGYTDLLWIGDCDSITSVVENSVTLVAGTDYQAEPVGQIDSQTGLYLPYDRLRRLDAAWYRNGPRATVTVTAKWGWSTMPASIVEACKFLTGDWLANRDVRGGVIGATADGFSIGVRKNPNVVRALKAVRHVDSWGV